MKLVLKLLVTVTLLWKVDSRFGTFPNSCLDNKSKGSPSKETEDHLECEEWQELSCCSTTQTQQIHENTPTPLAIMEPICGREFSSDCVKYHKAARCFYHCEPMLHHYQHENKTQVPYQTPICGDYCDDWFEACKNDETCIRDWENDSRDCPTDGTTCITYTQMYGNGQGLCNTIFSISLKYEASNKDCMVMQFEGDNPNIHGNPYGKNSANEMTCSFVVCLLGLWLIM